jgi:hypothetical protein
MKRKGNTNKVKIQLINSSDKKPKEHQQPSRTDLSTRQREEPLLYTINPKTLATDTLKKKEQ